MKLLILHGELKKKGADNNVWKLDTLQLGRCKKMFKSLKKNNNDNIDYQLAWKMTCKFAMSLNCITLRKNILCYIFITPPQNIYEITKKL